MCVRVQWIDLKLKEIRIYKISRTALFGHYVQILETEKQTLSRIGTRLYVSIFLKLKLLNPFIETLK